MEHYYKAITRFSPDGHLFQVDYAFEAVKRGACSIGLITYEAVILGIERKLVPKLQDPQSFKKIFTLDNQLAMAASGLTADARILANKARFECQQFRFTYGEDPSPTYIARFLAKTYQKNTQTGGVRPYGVSSLIIGFENNNQPKLYLTEPSGNFSLWKACAIGKKSKEVQELLEKKYKDNLNLEGGIKVVIEALLEVVDSASKGIEICYMWSDRILKFIPEEEINRLIGILQKDK